MLDRPRRGGTPLLVSAFALAAATGAQAQGAPSAPPADIVVTADRVPEPIQRSGSAISVVTRERLQTFSPLSLVDALRDVPGLDVTETGGPGATTSVRLRGANSGQTLVLIDGVRVNDPAAGSGDFDFSNLLPTAIERIEVLRGPQSALYGSDAIGGVVNIITRQGRGPLRVEAQTEGGSYGTLSSGATASGSDGPWSYLLSGAAQTSSGFSRYGYRIGRLESRFPRFEPDGFSREGGFARLGYDAGEGVRLAFGALSFRTLSQYDAATGAFPDTPSKSDRTLSQIWARATADQGPLTHSLQVSFNHTERTFTDISYRGGLLPRNTTDTVTEYNGDRLGAEYQGNLKLQELGSLIFGGKIETESADIFSTALLPKPIARAETLNAQQHTRSLFGLWQLPIGERLVLSLGGRHDEVNVESFDTWRATLAYSIRETGTKLRASAGTGGKAPTLFQLYSPQFGNAELSPERSIGWDAGIDQILFDGRATVSATYFENRFSNLIDFNSLKQRYINVTRAETAGVELEGRLELIPDFARLTGAYTYLHAIDLATHLTLARRPEHLGRIGLALALSPRWTFEPRVTLVSERFSGANETGRLAPYARLDLYSEYKLDAHWRVFGRVENLTNTHYQEVLNYGTTGRAFYGGASVTW